MAIKSQLRVQQLTGSIIDLTYSGSKSIAANPTAITDGDLGAVLGQFAGAIGRISGYNTTGAAGFTNAAKGIFNTNISPASDGGSDLGTASAEWGTAHTNKVSSAVALTLTGSSFDFDASGAIAIDSTVSGISLDGAAASNFTTSAGDLTVDSTAGSLNLTGGEADAAAVRIQADNAAGGIDVDAGTGGIAIDTTSGGAITVNATGAQLQLKTTTSGELDITSAGTLDINSVALDIDATGAITIDGSSTLSLDAAGATNLTTTSGTLTVSGSAGVVVAAGTTLDIDVAGAITMDSTSTIVISGDTGASLGDDTEALAFDGSGNVDFDAVALDIDASGAITMDSTSTIAIAGAAGASLGDDTEVLAYDGSGNVDFDAVALDIDASGAIAIDAATTIDIGGATGGNIGIGTHATAREVTIGNTTGASGVTINCGTGDVDIASSGNTTTIKGDFNVDEAATFDSTVSITGNLFVAGSTTTVSSSNLMVKDPIAAFGVASSSVSAGTNVPGPAGDRGFAFPMLGAWAGSPVLFWDHTSISSGVPTGYFTAGYAVTTGSSATISVVEELPVKAKSFYVDGTADYIDLSTDLRIVAAADVTFTAGGGNVKPSANDGAALGVTNNAWSDLFLANEGVVDWNAGSVTLTETGGNLLTLAGGNMRVPRLEIDGLTNYLDVMGGANDFTMTSAADIRLASGGADVQLRGGGTNDFMSIQRATATVGYLNFAANDGTAAPGVGVNGFGFRNNAGTMQLKNNGGSWADIASGVAATTNKGSETIVTRVVKNVDHDVATDGGITLAAWGTGSGALATTKEIYLNGQLLIGGADLDANNDWYPGTGNGKVKFEFALEVGDVLQYVLRT